MRLTYILLASGLLMLLRIATEPPPPLAPFYAVAHARAMHVERARSDLYRSPQKDVTLDLAIDTPKLDGLEDEYQSTPVKQYPNEVSNFSPSHAKVDNFSALYPTDQQNEPSQDSSNDVAMAEKPTPTVMPKTTTDSVEKATPAPVDKVMDSYRQPSALPVSGYAMYYNPNVMQEVLNNRLAMGHISLCGECIGNVALLRAGDLNRRVWLQWGDGTVEGPFLVADVAAPQHVAQLLARNWVVDVDYRTAARRGMIGPEMVTVLASPPSGTVATAEPFAPLYAAPTPVPTATPLPVISSEPMPTPPMTSLPVIPQSVESTAIVTQGGFPTETPTPTITPLPVLTSTYTPTEMPTTQPTSFPTLLPTLFPTVAATATPTLTVVPTSTPTAFPAAIPTLAPHESPTAVVTQRGFPTDTPVPTITPLPAINQSTGEPTATPTQ